MCHSGTVQNRHYTVSMSHDGLTKTFFALLKMQTDTYIPNINENDTPLLTLILKEDSPDGFLFP